MSRLDEAVDARLYEIREMVRSGATESVGRTIRESGTGRIVGRHAGGMSIMYPEIGKSGYTPSQFAMAVERGKGKVYLRIRRATKDELAKVIPRERKPRVEKPSIPAHESRTRKCKVCGVAHGKSVHRFHGEGSYHRTHAFAFGGNPRMKFKDVQVGYVFEFFSGPTGEWRKVTKDMVRKANEPKGKFYRVSLSADVLSAQTKMMFEPQSGLFNSISKRKARLILHEGKARGRRLTAKQRRFFGARASGYPARKQKNPGPRIIYGRVLRVDAQKTQTHICDDECKKFGHRYFHEFGPGAKMYGLPDGSILIKKDSPKKRGLK